jgi:hypothetical protein
MDNATLYDDDIVTWSEQQAAALRELASKPELSNAVDWGNVIEEIECLGRSEWKGVAGHLRNALAHVLKEVCDPDSFSRRAWAVETNNSLLEARDEFRDSMRQHIDIHAVWSRAFKQTAQSLEPYGVAIPPGIPSQCPFTLDDILAETFDHRRAVARLHEMLGQRPQTR